MENKRTMSFFGIQNGSEIPTSVPKPRGLGRGYRPQQMMPQSSFIGNGATRTLQKDSAGLLRDNQELGRVLQALQTASYPNGNAQLALLQREVSAEAERLSRSLSMLPLKMTNRREQMFNGASLDSRLRHNAASDIQRGSRSAPFGKAITIPMFWGEKVVLYVSRETCWIPMKLLEKIFNCPGVLLGAFSGCFGHSSRTNPDNSVCFNCLCALRRHFDQFLSDDTRPILENLQNILENHFKHRNGCPIQISSSSCIYQTTDPL